MSIKKENTVILKMGTEYPHKVGIFLDTKDRLVIRRDDTGDFHAGNAKKLHKAWKRALKAGYKPHEYAVWDDPALKDQPYNPRLVVAKWSQPKLVIREKPKTASGSKMRKIA